MATLKTLGMKKKWIYEGILETDGHFAAMGFYSNDFKSINIKVYHPAKTYSLLKKSERIALRLPSGVSDFLLLNRKSSSARRKLSSLPSLPLRITREKKSAGFSVFTFALSPLRRSLAPVCLINRAEMLALECLIDLSRERDISGKLETIKQVAPDSLFARELSSFSRKNHPLPHRRKSY